MADEEQKPGGIVHVEMAIKNIENAKKFCGEVFDWTFNDIPEMNYTMFETPSGPGGGIRIAEENEPVGVTNYISVASIDDAISKVESAGGKIVMPKQEVPGRGWTAWFQDPEGATFGLWESTSTDQEQE